MKQLFTVFFVVFFLSVSVKAQPYGWTTQTSGTTSNLNGVVFLNSNNGIIIGQSGIILTTSNGGTNWTTRNSGYPNHLFGLTFINSNTGWVVGDMGIILKTTNGGLNWVSQNSNTSSQLRAVNFISGSTGFAVGWYGVALKTTNGGTTWTSLSTGITNNLNGVYFVNSQTGYIVGWYGTARKTTNGGTSWSASSSGTSNTLESIYFLNSQTGWFIGESGLVRKSTNGGTSWSSQSSGTGNWLTGLTTPLSNYCTIVGASGTIRITTNGGTNWYSQTSNTGSALNKVFYSDTLNGWAVGDYGTIIHTSTSGWLLPPAPSLSGPSNNSTCISLTPNITWGNVFPPSCSYRVQISLSSSFATALIDSNYIVSTNFNIPAGVLNYATTYYWRVTAKNIAGTGPWSGTRNFTTTNPTPSAPALVSPSNNSTGQPLTPLLNWDSVNYASTFRVRLSADSTFTTSLIDTSGLTVTQFSVPQGILQLNHKYYWRVTASNSCVTSPWSQTWNFMSVVTGNGNAGIQLPDIFRLYQNFPNPFNPVTTIKFDLPKKETVRINIYDISGRLVDAPVNSEFKAGSYELKWNAQSYASGVYIYKIEAGEFSDIKRMILLK